MTQQTKRAEIVQVALTASLGYRKNVIRVPKRAPCPHRTQTPHLQRLCAEPAAAPLQRQIRCSRVRCADRTDAPVPLKNQVAQIAGVGTQPPLVYAKGRAKGAAARRQDLQPAPPAQRTRRQVDSAVPVGNRRLGKAPRRMLGRHGGQHNEDPRPGTWGGTRIVSREPCPAQNQQWWSWVR